MTETIVNAGVPLTEDSHGEGAARTVASSESEPFEPDDQVRTLDDAATGAATAAAGIDSHSSGNTAAVRAASSSPGRDSTNSR
mmetsp:Transcript_2750/g.6923  ORF Transcript_2750/g.6923 Transcript_2750/m.6923 type:complete len:83 (+) Transcript_2750:2-250(+)